MDKKTGVVISSPGLFQIARDAVLVTPAPSPAFSMTAGLTAVVFAAASVEALVNEVGELAGVEVRLGYQDTRLQAFVEAIDEVERSRGSTQLKFLVASTVLTGRPYQRGGQPYQDFAALMNLRNAIMHLRSTTLIEGTNGQWRLGAEAVLNELRARKLIDPIPPNVIATLLDEASKLQVARWAVDTAATMALSFIAMFPDPFRSDVLSDQSEVFRPLRESERR